MDTLRLEHMAIVLVEPQIPENIGSAARAMNNMGITRLILVNPQNCDLYRVLKMAPGSSIDIVEEMEVYEGLQEAIGPFEYVVGTTARTGSHRPTLTGPRRLARDLSAISQNNRIAILFGPEDRGLSNEHLRYCHTIATIPTCFWPAGNRLRKACPAWPTSLNWRGCTITSRTCCRRLGLSTRKTRSTGCSMSDASSPASP